jgi:hypothetical protein
MKKTIIATALLLSAVSSYAASGQGYKILSEETHSDPKFNLHVEHVQPGTALALKKSLSSGRTRTSVPNKSGRTRENISVDGYHDINIYNTTNQSQTYEYRVSLSCDNLSSYYTRTIMVYPNGSYSGSEHTYGTVQENYSGYYNISGETRLSGPESDSSSDRGSLSVRD